MIRLDEVQKQNHPVLQDSQDLSVAYEMHASKCDVNSGERIADDVPPPVVKNSQNSAKVNELQGTTEAVVAVCDSSDSNVQGSQCISFHDILYKVKQSKHCRRISDKVILNSVRYVHRFCIMSSNSSSQL